MSGVRIAADTAWGLLLGWLAYVLVRRIVPDLGGPLTLTAMLAISVLAVLVRYPGAGRRVFFTDLGQLVPPGVIKVLMAWIASTAAVGVLTLVAWLLGADVPDWLASATLLVLFALWFVPDLRRWAARRRAR